MGSTVAVGGHSSGAVEWAALGGHGSGAIERVAIVVAPLIGWPWGDHGSGTIMAACGVGGCPVCGLAAAADDDDEVVVVVEGAVVMAVAPPRLLPVELPQPEEPGWAVVVAAAVVPGWL